MRGVVRVMLMSMLATSAAASESPEVRQERGEWRVIYLNASDLSRLRIITEEERQEILLRYYDTHHEAFTKAVEEKIEKWGHCLIIDCHSFYPTALPYELNKNDDRPDFCIGTSDYHTPKKMTEALVIFFEGHGYSVKLNSPFAGTFVPMKYFEKDKRVYSVMIEVNRKLYMDVPGEKNNRFPIIQSVLKECIAVIEKKVE